MTGILKYNLNDPNDKRAFLCATELAVSVWEIQTRLYKLIDAIGEREDIAFTKELVDALNSLKTEVYNMLPDVNIEELII